MNPIDRSGEEVKRLCDKALAEALNGEIFRVAFAEFSVNYLKSANIRRGKEFDLYDALVCSITKPPKISKKRVRRLYEGLAAQLMANGHLAKATEDGVRISFKRESTNSPRRGVTAE